MKARVDEQEGAVLIQLVGYVLGGMKPELVEELKEVVW